MQLNICRSRDIFLKGTTMVAKKTAGRKPASKTPAAKKTAAPKKQKTVAAAEKPQKKARAPQVQDDFASLQEELARLREAQAAAMRNPEDLVQQQLLVRQGEKMAFDTEAFVQFNVAQVQVARSIVEENVTDAMQSWAINAGGNRELIMRTTDDVYRNRVMMLNTLKTETPEHQVFQESMTNLTKLQYLQHRTEMNDRMTDIVEEMAQAIDAVGRASRKFWELNEVMLEHVDEVADSNAEWLDGQLAKEMLAATAFTNDHRVKQSDALIEAIRKNSDLSRKRIRAVANFADGLGEQLNVLQDDGNELRDEVISIREKIDANQRRVGDSIVK